MTFLTYTVNTHYNGCEYNEQNLPAHNCEFLGMLRHQEGFGVRKLCKIKKNVITLCVSKFIAGIGLSYGVFHTPSLDYSGYW
jgi:hypothetical protein